MTEQTARVLPTEALRTFACVDCGALVFPDDVPADVLREYLRTGVRPERCGRCEQERGDD